jgi:hypothetical protein
VWRVDVQTREQLDECFAKEGIRYPLLAYCDGWAGETTLESPFRRHNSLGGWRQFEGLEGKLLPQFSDHEACILTTNMNSENI